MSNRIRNKIEEREIRDKNKPGLRRCIMKGKITKIESSRKKGIKQEVTHRNSFARKTSFTEELKKHSSPALPSPLNFKAKGE